MICQDCKLEKSTDFRKNRKVCRECDNLRERERRKQLKDSKKPESIICNVCKETKTDFRVGRGKCLDCEREHGKNYRRTTTKAKEWTDANQNRMSELQHNWYQKEKANVIQKVKTRLESDADFRAANSHRAGIRSLVHGGKTSVHVNCKGDRMRNWLQFQLDEGMTFDNYGTIWVIDHVVPIETFLSGHHPQEVVLNWRNVQPVLKRDNLTKNKYSSQAEYDTHLDKVNSYDRIRKLHQDSQYTAILSKFCETSRCGKLLRASDYHPLPETEDGKLG
jgi:hypothetical protein